MNLTKKNKLLIYIICTIAVISMVACVIGNVFNGKIEINNASGITNVALNSNYSAFANGSTYTYTDLNKVEAAHSDSSKSDTSVIVVDREQNHGSLQNPYVINSLAQWTFFAGNTGASDVDKVYVLGSDITFSSGSFTPVPYFYGKFFGAGHTLYNVTYNFGSNNDCGVFRVLHANGIIADLNLQNVNITSTGGRVATLVGTTNGGDILNCHAKGSVAGVPTHVNVTAGTISQSYPVGGLIGRANGNGIKVYIYRCSVNVKITVSAALDGASVGGILGGFSGSDGTASSMIYDCVAIVDVTNNSAGIDIWFGGIVNYNTFIGEQAIENCVSYIKATDNALHRVSWSSLFNGWAWTMSKLSLKNVFSDGILKFKGNSKVYGLPAAIYYNENQALSAISNVAITSENLNWYADNEFIVGGAQATLDVYAYRSLANTKYTGAAGLTQDDMYNKAQSDLPSAIWQQSGNITPSYMSNTDVTSTAGYTVDNAPNRNTNIKTEDFKIKYVNLENGAEKEYAGSETTYNYKDTTQMYTPSGNDSNHEFVGWTIDKTGNGETYKNIPSDLYGDVTVYAVWDVPQSSVSKESIISGESDGAFVKEYSDGSVLTLRADISITGMENPNITYKWQKKGEDTVLGTSSTYSIANVAESGEYELHYTVTDKAEPLWRHSGKTAAQSAEITPGQLYVKDNTFTIDSTTAPYKGRRLRDIKFQVEMVDAKGKSVEGTADWKTKVNQVQDGENREKITFVPNNGNYTSTGEYEVTFEAQYVTLTFNLSDVSDKIVINWTYNQSYTTNNVVGSFYKEFKDRMDNNSEYAPLNNMTPMFDGVNINDYSGSYTNVTESKTIEVTFEDTTYTVIFDPNNGEATFTNTSTLYYNNRLPKPTKDPINGDKLFLGWYFFDEVLNENGSTTTTEREWDFDTDTVTRDMTLTAKYLDAVLDLDSIEIKANKDEYTATEQLKAGDLTVTATYKGVVDGYGEYEQKVDLSFGQYSIEYENKVDNALHVGQGHITVSYKYKGVTKSAEITLTVVPKKIDTSGLKFNNKTVVYTGEAVSIDKIPVGSLPDEIANVNYVYTKGGIEVAEEDVIDIGTYTVQAIFETTSADYAAETLRATLQIKRAGELLKAEWGNTELQYNGKEQCPEVKFYDGNGKEVSVEFHYTGDVNAVNVGGGYKVRAELDDTAYQLDETTAECEFSITKAIMTAPTLKGDGKIVYNGNELKFEDYYELNKDLLNIASGGVGVNAGNYTAIIELKDTANCEWSAESGATGNTVQVKWSIEKAHLTAVWNGDEHVKDGNEYTPSVVNFVGIAGVDANAIDYGNDITYTGDIGKSEVGAYVVTAVLNGNAGWTGNYILDGNTEWAYVIVPQAGMEVITIEWDESELIFNGKVQMPSYKVLDKDGNDITEQVKGILKFGGDYDKSKWADDYTLTVEQPSSKYFIKSGLSCNYTITIDANGNGYNPNPDEDKDDDGGMSFDNVGEMLKQWWQVIASGVSIILIIIFFSKGMGYASKRKQNKRTMEDKYKTYYAAGTTGLFGIAMTAWTAIACILMGLAVLSIVFMLLEKKSYNKSLRDLNDAQYQYERNLAEMENARREEEKEEARRREEDMKMMFMSMMGGGQSGAMGQGMPQGAYMGGGYGIGAEEIRGIISETVTALLPGMQQMLPQQASTNDELVNKLIEQNEKLMQKLAEQPTEKVVEREVAASNSNDEAIKALIEGQKIIMEKLANQNVEPQVVEKIIEKEVKVEVPVEVEKIVEKVVEKPVEVEKIVEKEVRVEVPVEKVVEKVVEKEVKVKVTAPPKAPKEKAPRLTLDEAYEKLTKQQKKFFDGLREYAMSKEKCKEKKSTYFIVLGQSSVNPLIKLTVKKDTTVALFKMEDEYMKDIRRDAGSEGTKVKVKETEVIIDDAQAYATAKKMIDLREDQIERYVEYLKEQKAMR